MFNRYISFAISLTAILIPVTTLVATPTLNPDLSKAIAIVKAVDVNGKGNLAAVEAMQTLNQAKPADIPILLEAMNGSNTLVQNWLRSAIERALENDGEFPSDQVQAYLNEQSNNAMGRLLAFELLTNGDDEKRQSMIPGFLDDSSLPLRRMAVAHFIDAGKNESDKAKAIAVLKHTLVHTRDVDQVKAIIDHLATLDIEVNLAKQLGFIQNWKLYGTYDNTDEKGYHIEYQPETLFIKHGASAVPFGDEAEFGGKGPKEHQSEDPTGVVDLTKVIGKEKSAIVYALGEFNSSADQEVDIRIGCINAHKVWVNGKLAIDNEIYHVGMQADQFSGRAKLKKGKNHILFKVCQNDDKAPWAQRWMYQLRVCDETGKAIEPAGK